MGLFDSSDSGAEQYLQQALQAYNNVAVPTVASEQVSNLPQQSVQGTVNPNQIQVAAQAPSAYNDISLDPATRAAQMAALSSYQDIANAGGLDPAAKLALQQTIDAANVQSQGAQGAIQQQAQAMGQGGGDFALTQRAIAAQGASNNAATQGLETAAMAEANRQAALNQMASIGSNVNASDYAQAQAKANAQNTINATNQAATNAANTGNVANKLQAGEFNVGTAQGVNAANTAANQGQVYYNAGLPQQQFNNELAKAGGIAGVSSQQANAAQNAQNAGLGFTGSLLGTAGTLGATAMGGPAAGALAAKQTKTASNGGMIGYSKGGYTCYADGGIAHDHAICMKLGGHVAGEAEVEGDSPENDTVPALLSPGEIVVKRSKASDPDSAAAEAKRISLEHFTKGYRRGK
jgi:hypothetical protein